MNLRLKTCDARRTSACGTTLTELMVAMGVLLIMFLVMSTLVSGIQKMFRGGRGQADVLENGRAAMDMIVRDIEQMAAANTAYDNCMRMNMAAPYRIVGTNVLYQGGEFFCTSYDTNWHATAYGFYDRAGAFSNLTSNVSGKLYRWQTNNAVNSTFWTTYAALASGNYTPVVDGVVHLRIQPISFGVLAAPAVRFLSNSLPTHIEVELGVVESSFAENLSGRPLAEQTALLTANLNKIYLFRQLVPIKNAHK